MAPEAKRSYEAFGKNDELFGFLSTHSGDRNNKFKDG